MKKAKKLKPPVSVEDTVPVPIDALDGLVIASLQRQFLIVAEERAMTVRQLSSTDKRDLDVDHLIRAITESDANLDLLGRTLGYYGACIPNTDR